LFSAVFQVYAKLFHHRLSQQPKPLDNTKPHQHTPNHRARFHLLFEWPNASYEMYKMHFLIFSEHLTIVILPLRIPRC